MDGAGEKPCYSPSSGCDVTTVLTISQLTWTSASFELSQTTSRSPSPQSMWSTWWSRASACMRSLPAPPFSVSAPRPTQMRSSPLSPFTTSSPQRPRRTSLPSPPLTVSSPALARIRSLPDVPVSVSLFQVPLIRTTRWATAALTSASAASVTSVRTPSRIVFFTAENLLGTLPGLFPVLVSGPCANRKDSVSVGKPLVPPRAPSFRVDAGFAIWSEPAKHRPRPSFLGGCQPPAGRSPAPAAVRCRSRTLNVRGPGGLCPCEKSPADVQLANRSERHQQTGDAGDVEGELRPADVRKPAGEQAAERREPGEGEEVEAEDSSAQVVGRRQLQERLAV